MRKDGIDVRHYHEAFACEIDVRGEAGQPRLPAGRRSSRPRPLGAAAVSAAARAAADRIRELESCANAREEEVKAHMEFRARAEERLQRIDDHAGRVCEAQGCRHEPCGPVEYEDVEGVPLCAECWQECLDEAAEESAPAAGEEKSNGS